MVYIGITVRSVRERWIQHQSCARRNLNYPLYNAINKYGIDVFVVEQVYQGKELKEIRLVEEQLIEKYSSNIRFGKGYNLTFGGEYVDKMSLESIEKSRLARIGRKRTNEQKIAISRGRVGKGLKNDAARKHPKEMVLKAMKLLKEGVKQKEIVSLTGLTQSYISNLKTKKRGLSLSGD
jgi:hypothetical protein